MKKIALLTLTLLWSLSANAALFDHPVTDGAIIEQQIPQPEIYKSDFTQIKKISGLQKDLKSSGKIMYAKNKGFYFEIHKPFAATYIFTKKGLMQIEDGQKNIISADKQPFFHEFSEILQSIFSGKYDQLSKHFDVYFEQQGKKWTLGLRPTNSTVNSVITEIIVTGSKNTETVTFKEKNGDTTQIKLSNNGKPQLTGEEENYFNF
jgi:hypothetical protein